MRYGSMGGDEWKGIDISKNHNVEVNVRKQTDFR